VTPAQTTRQVDAWIQNWALRLDKTGRFIKSDGRNLTTFQRALIDLHQVAIRARLLKLASVAARKATRKRGGDQKSDDIKLQICSSIPTRAETAKQMGVSERTVNHAAVVIKSGAPEPSPDPVATLIERHGLWLDHGQLACTGDLSYRDEEAMRPHLDAIRRLLASRTVLPLLVEYHRPGTRDLNPWRHAEEGWLRMTWARQKLEQWTAEGRNPAVRWEPIAIVDGSTGETLAPPSWALPELLYLLREHEPMRAAVPIAPEAISAPRRAS
jgi:hypothetical protein